jgi:hypothetical protein
MNAKSLAVLFLVTLSFASAAVLAEPPRGGGPHDKGDGGKGERREKWDRDREAKFREQMEKDWEEAKANFRELSPLRAAAFDKMSEDQQNFFKPLIIGRWRGMKWLERDPELRRNKEVQIRVEDDIFGIKQKLAAAPTESPDVTKLKTDLRKKVEVLVEERMRERELRIERLQMLIEEERELLKEDQFKREALIDKRMQDILAAEVPVIDPPQPPPGPPGDRRRAAPPEKRPDDAPKRD